MSGIYFGNHLATYREIEKGFTSTNNYYQLAANFCQSYLAGDAEYPVKTSGSTGLPKIINLTRQQLRSSAAMTIKALDLQPSDKALVCISIEHIGGKMMLVRGMELAMEMHLVEPHSDLDVTGLPAMDFVALVPVQLQALIRNKEGREFLAKCKSTIIGGAGIDPSTEKYLEHFKNPIYHTFGMTESASHFALRRLNGPEKQQVYQVLEGVNVSKDDRGCLVVSGELTNNKQLKTNDLIDLTGKNSFRWLGRRDSVINTGGHKVHPESLQGSIENILTSLSIGHDFVLIGLPHAKWGEQVTMVLESHPLDDKSELQLLKHLKRNLHAYEVPKQFRYLKPFPRTLTGKIDIPKLCKGL